VTWFEGGWADFEAYKGADALNPHRIKFRKLATV
jgi:hypothetical protein